MGIVYHDAKLAHIVEIYFRLTVNLRLALPRNYAAAPKYAFEVLTLPSGLRIGGMMSLEYMQRLAKVLAKEGDGWGDKHNCTILGDTEGGDEIVSYKLIMDSTEDEFDAILGAAAAFGGYHPIILQVVYD